VKSGDFKPDDKGGMDYDMLFSQCSGAITHVVKTCATQHHLLRPQQITRTEYWHNRQSF
jgi:hypothetical protein